MMIFLVYHPSKTKRPGFPGLCELMEKLSVREWKRIPK